ncbi:serine protease [Rhodococcus sp. SORGH_AS_0303]|uniref:serine protease n=1 Tax=Rhodococcus sp. SORGH_AS_0303 TaxID=3041753 RepID=UPI00278B7607|nr:serine protease [Rhodococcus sp. SORGH_AS_0303]MDQ1203585.1 hypothetical protein [Rhodococcus sp. SORGH_AS_0303]
MRVLLVGLAVLCSLVLGGGAQASAAERVELGGGSGLVLTQDGRETLCSLTVIGADTAGRTIGLTAGHCGRVGDTVASESDSAAGDVGSVVAVLPAYDTAIIEFDAERVAPVASVGSTTITAVGDPARLAETVCKQGRTTGATCGVSYGDVLNSQQVFAQVCVNAGDSGAPVVRGASVVGMVNAYLVAPCIGPAVVTDLVSILRAIDESGGPGAGLRLTA